MGATGYVLTIPDEVLKKLELADTKINAIAESSEKTANRFNQAFSSMALSVDPLIKRLDALKNIGKLDLGSGLKKYTSDSEKAAAGIAEVANKLNQLKYISSQSSSANNSVLAWQGINENLKIQQQRLDAINRSIKEYENTLSQIQSGKGGVLSKEDQSNYASNLAEAESIKQTIALYQQKQQAIVNYQLEQKKVADNLAKLKSLESDSKSLPEQRKREELERLNALYRSGQSLLQKQAKEEDRVAAANEKAAKAAEKAAEAEQKKAAARANKANQEAARAEEQYARALNKSEVTIVQRARKIEALANAQRALNSTGRDYSSQLSKIASETQRLQQANDNVAKSMERVKRSQSSVLNTTDQLTRKIALLFSVAAIQGYVEKLISVRGEFELQQRALQAILQNKDEANALWEKTVALAIKSPFQVKELVTYTKQLAAYRIESDKLYDTTKMLADVSAGLGVDMGRLILAYGQVKAANYLRASEVRQFTEAGVNILGELADIYTELEGRMVSVGQVQERITKRMVAFGDVEKVFKRITSAGGIFYNMQEIQAETLAGMISNLKDNFDVMFNDIGKANDGVLKGLVNIINELVAHWRIFAAALKGATVGFVLYAAKVAIATAANRGFTASSIEATIAQKGLAGAMARSVSALKGIGSFAKANPWVAIATVVAAVGYAMYDNYKQVEQAKEKYEILNRTLDSQKSKLESLISKIEKQRDIQDETNNQINNLKKGTKEYNDAIEKNNKAKEQEVNLLKILKAQYPEIYSSISKQKDGVKELRKEQAKYNEELRQTQILNDLMKEEVPFFGNTFAESASEFAASVEDRKKAAEKLGGTYDFIASKFDRLIQMNKSFGIKYKQAFDQIDKSNLTSTEKFSKLYDLVRDITQFGVNIPSSFNADIFSPMIEASNDYFKATKEFKGSTDEIEKQYQILERNALLAARTTKDAFAKLSEEEKKKTAETIKNYVLSATGTDDPAVLAFLRRRLKDSLSISVSFDKPKVEKELDDLAKLINSRVAEINKELNEKTQIKPIKAEEGTTDYIDNLLKQGQALTDEADRVSRAQHNIRTDLAETKELAAETLREAGKATIALAKEFGAASKKEQNKEESAYEKRLRAQLDLLKKMQSQYEKLRQTMGEEDATSTITSSFGTAYQKLFNKPLKLKFDKASMANEMESIYNTISGKSAEALKRSWQSTIGEFRSEITVSATLDNISEFERQMDSMFNSYQLYIELEAKGVPKDLIQNLFGIDVTTLDDIARALEEKYPDVTKLGEKELDSYFKIQKKITDNQKNELKRRSDLLYNYLEQSVDKVKQVQNSGALEISFATDFLKKGSLNAEQYATVVKNVTDKVNKEVSKINLDKFKETPEYIQAMGDLSAYSASQLEAMIAKMQELINSSAGNLSASDLKVYTDFIDKIQGRLKQIKSPFSKNAFAEFKELKRLQAEFNAETERYNQLLEEQKQAKKNLANVETEVQQAQDRVGIDASAKDDLIAATENLQDANSALNNSNDKLDISQGKLTNISGKMGQIQGGMSSAMSMIDKIVTGIYQSIEATIDIMNQFKELQESQGVDTSKGGWREAAQAGELLGNVNNKVMSSWNNFKSGNIAGAVADAVGSITTIFTTLNKQHDARREQTIQEEIKQVEKLQKAYQRLGDAIENAYTIDTLNMSTENAQRNIQDQIKSYQNMIAAEEDKKDTDWDRIDEWKEAITDLQEQANELQNQKIAELGGFGSGADMKSAAEEFASAWLEAYKETGDGLTALEDKWDEYINNVIMKQLALRGIEKFLEPIMKNLDNMIGSDSYLSNDELEALQKQIDETMPALNEYFKTIAENFGVPITGGEDNGSTLNKGIQGVTEETANVIEAYLNSMRYFVADTNMVINNFFAAFTSLDPLQNPMYSELANQTKLLRSIDDRLASVITYSGDHPNGGAALKTVI